MPNPINNSPVLQLLQKRHEVLVKLHKTYTKTVKLEMQKAWKRDIGFLKTFVTEASPVKVEFDEKLWEELSARSPIKVEIDPEFREVVEKACKSNDVASSPSAMVIHPEASKSATTHVPPEGVEPQL